MKRNTFKAAITAICLLSIALPSHAFSLFGWLKKENSIESMIEYVPADTAMFMGGISDKSVLTASDSLLATYNVDNASQVYAQLMESLPDTAGKDFALWLIDDYYKSMKQGGEALYNRYGFDINGASLIYLDGIYPVIRMALTDEAAFLNVLKQAAAASEMPLTAATVAGNSVTVIELLNEDDVNLNLGFFVSNKILTISVYSQNDNPAALAQRFALTKPASAMSVDTWKQDGKTYNLTEHLRGYVSFINIAKIVLNQDNLGNKQLAAFLGDDMAEFIEAQGQCQADILALTSGMPRLVMGVKEYNIKNNALDMAFSFALEINNMAVLSELKKLPGFLPEYLTKDSNLALGYGIGLSADSLSPVITSLWTQFTEAEFSCEPLQTAQAEAANTNPAVLAMFTGMAQGLSGISAGVFDFIVNEESILGGDIDAIVTVTAEKPEVLAALISNYVPFIQGTKIPTDGTPVSLADAGLPVDAYLAIKGKHLVAYSGTNGKRVADELASQPTAVNGTSAFAFNYQKTATLALAAIGPMSTMQGLDDCTELYSSSLMLKSVPATVIAYDNFTDKGYESTWTIAIDDITQMSAFYGMNIDGNYDVQYLDYDCSWVDLGTETFNADGTGTYTEQDDTGSCNLYESNYTWSNPISAMIQSNSVNQYRDSCDSEWEEDESYDFSCQMLAPDESGFYCLETSDGVQTLHRYLAK